MRMIFIIIFVIIIVFMVKANSPELAQQGCKALCDARQERVKAVKLGLIPRCYCGPKE